MKKSLPYILIAVTLLLAAGFYIDRTSKQDAGIQSPIPPGTAQRPNLKTHSRAPEFAGIERWLNSGPLTMQELKGKVVLVDFWTYSCINCIRTLPYVTKWYDTYKDAGFVVIGVHTPEFAFEKVTGNVETAIQRHAIHYPVAQDNDYKTWSAYDNHYWPAKYLVDKTGNIVYTHFGEGDYDSTENAIRRLLGMDAGNGHGAAVPRPGAIKTPEIYFGTSRLESLAPEQSPSAQPAAYRLPATISLNRFALEGIWKFENENIVLTQGSGKVKFKFHAGKIHMVAAADKPITVSVTVDGMQQNDVTVYMSDLYTLFDSDNYAEHEIEISIPEPGFEAFTFTFG